MNDLNQTVKGRINGIQGIRLNIQGKLLAAFAGVLVLLIVVSAVASVNLSGLKGQAKDVNDKWLPTVVLLGTMNGDVSDVERLVLNIIVEERADELTKLKAAYTDLLVKIEGERRDLQKLLQTDEEKQLYEQFSAEYDAYLKVLPELLEAAENNEMTRGQELHRNIYSAWYAANDTIMKLINLDNQTAAGMTDEAVDKANIALKVVMITSLVAILLAILVAFVLARLIAVPLRRVQKAAQWIADGDLSKEAVQVRNRDEIGELAKTFNEMADNLRVLLKSVAASSEMVAASSEELTASAEQTTQATSQIAESVQETSIGTSRQAKIAETSVHAMEEMAAGADEIAVRAQSVAIAAADASRKSESGNEAIQQAITQMDAIRESVTSLGGVIKELGVRSEAISAITGEISAISSQTNLLALNASIEAARAGEMGRGFAVVAGEVRKLAEQSTESAKRISDLISLIQEDAINAIEAAEQNRLEVQQGINLVALAGESFSTIKASVSQVAGDIEEVSAGAQEMSASTNEVVYDVKESAVIAEQSSSAMTQVSAATQEQLASMEEIASSSAALSKAAEELQQYVNRFKL
ncbi:methyl-accepting chemotaxis protein [Gorillibacterium sp. CAU 1737]|uniref:methyl-accepting chemotaxis protein n=1 Tax=Gorillibacterium sp. CAU 1737 TaxID=3140362 RepID=UPI003261B8DE